MYATGNKRVAMFGRTITIGDPPGVLEEKRSTAIVLGYGVITIVLWLLSMMVNRQSMLALTEFEICLILGGSSVLLMALGLITRKYGQDEDTTVFLSMSLFSLCLSGLLFISIIYSGNIPYLAHHAFCNPIIGSKCYSWVALAWGIVFGYLSAFTHHSDLRRILFLLMLCIGVTIGAIAGWADLAILKRIGGYVLLIAAICAFLNAVSSYILLEMKKPFH